MEKITDDIEKIYISNGNNENLQVNNICETDEKSQDFLNNETNENINVYQTSINSSTKYRRQFRDPTWLKVEVCREFLRNECTRNQEECKFAHPGFYCVIDNGKVITCYDSLKVMLIRYFSYAYIYLRERENTENDLAYGDQTIFHLKLYILQKNGIKFCTLYYSYSYNFSKGNFGSIGYKLKI
uniref:Muscleblind-like protein 2a (Trinotate prediction) n=1 Tax=Henneguya salminicola TaxID=69463 RepID=A0A6G3MI82_HENSL